MIVPLVIDIEGGCISRLGKAKNWCQKEHLQRISFSPFLISSRPLDDPTVGFIYTISRYS